jgi:hypothetical protein
MEPKTFHQFDIGKVLHAVVFKLVNSLIMPLLGLAILLNDLIQHAIRINKFRIAKPMESSLSNHSAVMVETQIE